MVKTYYAVKTTTIEDVLTSTKDLAIGEMGIVLYGLYKGEVLLKIYDEDVISLTRPENTWGKHAAISVRKLQPGETVTLTVKENK